MISHPLCVMSPSVLPNPEITHVTSSGVIEANCTAAARPAAQMVWNVEGDNRTLGPSVSSSYDQGDGTTLVTSTLLLQEGLPHDQSVKCMVHHRGLDSPMSVNLNGEQLRESHWLNKDVYISSKSLIRPHVL